jgi:hypothetical protein
MARKQEGLLIESLVDRVGGKQLYYNKKQSGIIIKIIRLNFCIIKLSLPLYHNINQYFMKQIPNYTNYTITEDGKTIINTTTGRLIKQGIQQAKGKPTGYLYATLFRTIELYRRIAVHRLVAITYIDNPEGKPWVNHKDGNKENNHVSNLEWTTIAENIQHAHATGLIKPKYGADHWRFGKKLSQETKKLQSKAKIGENHPKFKGWYIINGSKFSSLNEAERLTKIDRRTLKKRCNDIKALGYTFLPKQ